MLLLLKILSQLAYPLAASWLLAAGGGFLLWRNRRRTGGWLLALALTWLWLWSTPAFSDWICITLEQRYPPIPIENLPVADAIVVLGGATQSVRPPKRIYPDLDASADRIVHTARLFRAGKAPLIIASGGNLPSSKRADSEAAIMAELLQELGVPASAILPEMHSRTTRENFDYTLPILHRLGAHRILLVTSALHMPRALALFNSVDLEVTPAPTDFEAPRTTWRFQRWLPDARALNYSSRALKEYLGLLINQLIQTWKTFILLINEK
ncbi:MAG: YdcF family protein [Candidatus Competibacteraceae bacterium]|nr:YdcF family protein [Candidatus Competibacteraceae bacterium]